MMSDLPHPLTRTQSIGEGFYHSIPKVTLFGSHLKDHEKTSHHGIVKRCCHVRISRLEFISDSKEKIPSTIRIAVGLNKIRRSLITAPIDLSSCLEEVVSLTGPIGITSVNNNNSNNEKAVGLNGPTGISMQITVPEGEKQQIGPTGIASGSGSAPISISPSATGNSNILMNGPSPSSHLQYLNPNLSPRAVREMPPPNFIVPVKKVYCYPMDIRISFHYDHSLKERDDYVKITMFRNLPFSKRQREQYIPFAFAETNLSQILQQGDFIADLDMTTFLESKTSGMDNLVIPTSINVTICSVPKEIENIGDAQEYQLNDIGLSDDENLFFDSDSYDEDDEEVISYDIPINKIQITTQTQQQQQQPQIQIQPQSQPTNSNLLQVPNTSGNSTSSSTTPPITSLSHRLMEQYEESKKKSIEKKSKLQKLSSLIKPTTSGGSSSKHSETNYSMMADDEDDRDDNSVDSSSSESDQYDIEFNPPQIQIQTLSNLQPIHPQPLQPNVALSNSGNSGTGSSKKFHPLIQQQRDSPPSSPFSGLKNSGSDHFGDSSKLMKQSQIIDAYINTISNPDSPMNLFLVNSLRKGGKKLEQYLEKSSAASTIKTKFNVVPTRSNVDLNSIFKAILQRHQNRSENIRVVIAGSDSYINSVLKAYVTLLSTKPRGWDPFQFYLLPIGKSNEIASTIANHDPNYHALFIQPQSEWKRFFDSDAEPDAQLKRDLEAKILSYIDKTNTRYAHKFPIGEALLTFPSTTSTAIPFLKGIQIPKSEDIESSNEPDLKIDYWVPKKKGGDDHLEIKIPFQYVKLTRLSQITSGNSSSTSGNSGSGSNSQSSTTQSGTGSGSSGSKSSTTSTTSTTNETNPPNSSNSFSLYVLYKDKRSKKNAALSLPKFGKQKRSEKEKVSYKKEEKSSISLVITKLMCGPIASSSSSSSTINPDTIFQVNIDGVEIPGVQYLSVSPQWATHVKQFSIQTFVDTLISERSTYSPVSD